MSYWTRFMTVLRTVSKRRQVKNEKVEEVIRRKSSRAQTKKNGGLPPHWPQDRSLAAVYVTVVFIEVCFFNANLSLKNFIGNASLRYASCLRKLWFV